VSLANHPGNSPVLTWDGAGPYTVQPDPRLVPIDEGHLVILSQEQLAYYLDRRPSEATGDDYEHAARWLETEREDWFRDARTDD